MSSKASKKFNIFFDTNILETRFGKDQKDKSPFLIYDEFKLPVEYSKILDFATQNKIMDDVQLCIPEVVWREMIQHMREGYSSKKQSVTDVMGNYKKAFGELAEINCSFKIENPDDYEEYLKTISKKFWEQNAKDCIKIPHPKSKAVVEKLINKAFCREKPFVETKGSGGKIYSDAGLKDALIIETMLFYCDRKDAIGILFSNDTDFKYIFDDDYKEKFKVFTSVDQVIDYLEVQNNLNKEKLVCLAFENNFYLKESVVDASGNPYDISVTDFNVKDVNKSDEDGVYIVKIYAVINEAKYNFEVEYDLEANEILDSSYKIENE